MYLAYVYFIVYLLLALAKEFIDPENINDSTIVKSLQLATFSVNLAPMLAVLFIGARMRALQLDPVNGSPQPWAQMYFYVCTIAIALQAFFVILLPNVLDVTCRRGEFDGDVKLEAKSSMVQALWGIMRWTLLLAIYGGATAVIISIFTIEAPSDLAHRNIPVTDVMLCVINLTLQFFTIYILFFIAATVRELIIANDLMKDVVLTLESARATVTFCPMLCILFLGCKLRASQISQNLLSPQSYAISCMYLATWSVLFQLIMVIVAPLITGKKVDVDDDGNVKTSQYTGLLYFIVEGVRYLCLIAMYGGAIAVIYAVFTMSKLVLMKNEPLFVDIPTPVSIPTASEAAAPAAPTTFF